MSEDQSPISNDVIRPISPRANSDMSPRLGSLRAKLSISAPKTKLWGKRALLTAGFPAYFGGMFIAGWIAHCSTDLPSPERLWTQTRPVSVQIVDRHGRDVIVRGASEAPRVKIEDLPEYLPQAVLATEDRRFYSHVGVDPKGFARAMVQNVRAGRYVQGGSTLTQQLAKNVFLSPEKTIKRKTQEMMLSVWLEHEFTKPELLEMYLSRVYFGAGSWGAEAATRRYFGKSANDITLGEAAMIAGVLKAPSRYNPVANSTASSERTAGVLSSMLNAGYIDRAQQLEALTQPINIRTPTTDQSTNYFVDWIWDDLVDAIGVPTRDIVVQTTLDSDAQLAASNAVNAHVNHERNAGQAALVTIDGTGGVLAMVGGTSYAESQFNRAVQAKRQPGSAFKPFVYLSAFQAGLNPWDTRVDEPITLGDWEPSNYNDGFRGEMTLETAFANSVNTVAIQLSEEVGPARIVQTAKEFGFDNLRPLRSLALGSQTTTPIQLTAAFLPFANWGDYAKPHGIISISTSDGTPLYDYGLPDRKKLLDSRTLGHINKVMKHTVDAGTGRRAQIAGHDVAGKTGTTNDYRDAWFVGYVPDMVTGVWVGADDFTPMKKVTGGSLPTLIWHDYMDVVLDGKTTVPLAVSHTPIAVRPSTENAPSALDSLLNSLESALP